MQTRRHLSTLALTTLMACSSSQEPAEKSDTAPSVEAVEPTPTSQPVDEVDTSPSSVGPSSTPGASPSTSTPPASPAPVDSPEPTESPQPTDPTGPIDSAAPDDPVEPEPAGPGPDPQPDAGSPALFEDAGSACNDTTLPFEQRCVACAEDACALCLCTDCTAQAEVCANTEGCTEILACVVETGCEGTACYCGTADPVACLAGMADGPCKDTILATPSARLPTLDNPSLGPAGDAVTALGSCTEPAGACAAACQ